MGFFFNDYKIYEVPNRFSYQHVLLMLISALYIIVMIFVLRKLKIRTQRIIMISIISVCLLIFAGRMFFGWEGARIYNKGSKNTLLPLELCNLNIIVTLVALIINKKSLNNYLYYVSMLGAMISLIVFPDIHMITRGNNLFHYMFWDYYLIHTNLVGIPIWMICCKWFHPSSKYILKTLLITVGIYFSLFIISTILRNFESFKTANYMYVIYHDNLPVLKTLYKLIPIPFLYGLPLVFPVSFIFYLMSLPFIKKEKKDVRS